MVKHIIPLIVVILLFSFCFSFSSFDFIEASFIDNIDEGVPKGGRPEDIKYNPENK